MFDVNVPKDRSTSALLFRGIPRDVRDRFKGVAHGRGDSMQDVIVALMRKYIQNPECVRVSRGK